MHAAPRYRILLTSLVLVLTSAGGFCQIISQSRRFEQSWKGGDDAYTIVNMGAEGLCMVRHQEKFLSGKKVWEFIWLDSALQTKINTTFEMDSRETLVGYEPSEGSVFFLFREGDTNRNGLILMEFTASGGVTKHNIKSELDFRLTHFIKCGHTMVFGGYVSKDPVVLLYDLESKLIKVVPGFFQKDNELVDLRTNVNNTFNAVLIDRSNRDDQRITLRIYDDQGELLLEDIVKMEDFKTLQTCITSTLEKEELLVVGSWGQRSNKTSVGLYALRFDPFADQKINYIDFASLTHYLDQLKPQRIHHIQEASERDKKNGRIPDFSNYIMPFKLIENQTGFIVLAEAYEVVTSSSSAGYPYGPYGAGYPALSPYSYYYNPYYPGYFPNRMYNPYGNTRTNEQIKTTEAAILAFDTKGKLLWDQSMKIDNISRSSLAQVSDFTFWNGELIMTFKDKDGNLAVKKVEPLGENVELKNERVKLMDPADELRNEREQDGGIRNWYDNSFYAWGYQTIRNVTQPDRVRDVFYINKVVIH